MVDVSKDTVAIRSIDWDRDRFDIEFGYASLFILSFLSLLQGEGMYGKGTGCMLRGHQHQYSLGPPLQDQITAAQFDFDS